jgi:hypothetical protein
MKRLVQILTFALTASCLYSADNVARPREKNTSLPDAFKSVDPSERLKALRVAEVDATRLLAERIYGVHLDADTTVYDLALQSDGIRSKLRTFIKGVSDTEAPTYKDDGSVEVVRSVKLRQVVETIIETTKQLETKTGLMTLEQLSKVERQSKDTVISVMGNGALPDSKGLRRIQAKRAAEVDAYRKLAERVMGLQVTSTTTVKNFVLESDVLEARCAAFIKGAKPIDIAYDSDDSCEVQMQLKVAEVIEIIRRYARNKPIATELTKVERDYSTKTFTETGRGAPRPLDKALQATVAPQSEEKASDGVFKETEIVIKRVVGQETVVE